MKTLHLIQKNIINLIKHKTITFFTVIFSTTVIVFGILFYYGYLLYNFYDRIGKDVDTITLRLSEACDNAAVADILSKLESDNTHTILVSDKDLSEKHEEIIGGYHTSYDKRILAGKYYDRHSKDEVIILPEYLVQNLCEYNKNPFDSQVQIDGNPFVIEGIVSMTETDCYETPIDYYIEHYPTLFIKITYSKNLTKNEIAKIKTFLNSNHKIESYEININKPALLSLTFWIDFIQIFVIFLLMISNLFIILFFWIKTDKRMYHIYSIVGGSKSKIIKLMILQNSLVLLIGYIIGLTIFFLCKNILVKWNLVYAIQNNGYITASLLFYLASVAAMTIMILKIGKPHSIYLTSE